MNELIDYDVSLSKLPWSLILSYVNITSAIERGMRPAVVEYSVAKLYSYVDIANKGRYAIFTLLYKVRSDAGEISWRALAFLSPTSKMGFSRPSATAQEMGNTLLPRHEEGRPM